uniref:C3H1-type domain-containing protein n=1 Tax=Kalanchoe fedtschenkoi TaxID=63787 RepID=A0A7N0VHA0_KALFE
MCSYVFPFFIYAYLLFILVLYHHNIVSTHNPIGQNDWLSMSYLAKRPRIEGSSILPIYPQRPGEKDCTHYMLTRTCKFGETCKFDHPIWVPEGGIPDWKEVPPVATECLPERSGEPDCPYFLKTQRCKFGLMCKFNHPKEKLVYLNDKGESGALPERPFEPICAFYLKTGICKFGATCRFHHPKDIQRSVLEQGSLTAELKSFSAKIQGTTGDVKPNVILTPALAHNAKGLPVRPGELDCPFYLKTGSCKYSVTCRYNHPDRTGTYTVDFIIILYITNKTHVLVNCEIMM